MAGQDDFKLRSSNEGKCIAVVGDIYRFLAVGEETDGKYAIWEAIVPPGGGPPLHVHSREVEGFYILDGEITFQVEDDKLVASAGSYVNMPVGVRHAFKNESDQSARMLIQVAPAGLENYFFQVGHPVADMLATPPPVTEDDLQRLMEVAANYGVTIFPPNH